MAISGGWRFCVVVRENRPKQKQILRFAKDDNLRGEVSGVVGLKEFEVGFGGFQFGEEAFFGLELAGVDAAAAGFDADWVL